MHFASHKLPQASRPEWIYSAAIGPEIDHTVQLLPLPNVAPLTGKSPIAISRSLLALDEAGLALALASPLPPINEPIPGCQGKTVLHLATFLYGQWKTSPLAQRQRDADRLGRMMAWLLEAGADPLARDRDGMIPSARAEAIPDCLRDALLQQAAHDKLGWQDERECGRVARSFKGRQGGRRPGGRS